MTNPRFIVFYCYKDNKKFDAAFDDINSALNYAVEKNYALCWGVWDSKYIVWDIVNKKEVR